MGKAFHFLGFKPCLLEKAGELSIVQAGQHCIPRTSNLSVACFDFALLSFLAMFLLFLGLIFNWSVYWPLKVSPASLQEDSCLDLQCYQMYVVPKHSGWLSTRPQVCLGDNEKSNNWMGWNSNLWISMVQVCIWTPLFWCEISRSCQSILQAALKQF